MVQTKNLFQAQSLARDRFAVDDLQIAGSVQRKCTQAQGIMPEFCLSEPANQCADLNPNLAGIEPDLPQPFVQRNRSQISRDHHRIATDCTQSKAGEQRDRTRRGNVGSLQSGESPIFTHRASRSKTIKVQPIRKLAVLEMPSFSPRLMSDLRAEPRQIAQRFFQIVMRHARRV